MDVSFCLYHDTFIIAEGFAVMKESEQNQIKQE